MGCDTKVVVIKGCNAGDNIMKGGMAEEIAYSYLMSCGLELTHRNWRSGRREIDLIMTGPNLLSNCKSEAIVLHFVEVRSLCEPSLQMPFETVDYAKQQSIIKASVAYIAKYKIHLEAQFDVVSILFKREGGYELEYFPNAFAPEW